MEWGDALIPCSVNPHVVWFTHLHRGKPLGWSSLTPISMPWKVLMSVACSEHFRFLVSAFFYFCLRPFSANMTKLYNRSCVKCQLMSCSESVRSHDSSPVCHRGAGSCAWMWCSSSFHASLEYLVWLNSNNEVIILMKSWYYWNQVRVLL